MAIIIKKKLVNNYFWIFVQLIGLLISVYHFQRSFKKLFLKDLISGETRLQIDLTAPFPYLHGLWNNLTYSFMSLLFFSTVFCVGFAIRNTAVVYYKKNSKIGTYLMIIGISFSIFTVTFSLIDFFSNGPLIGNN
jgi:hypothetical protein